MFPGEQRRGQGRNKNHVRRVKTFSGCWTCRSRKVKCDEERPTCRRCNLASLVCKGYHVKLVWDPEDSETLASRRCIFDGLEHLRPVLSHEFIQSALADIDAFKNNHDLQIGPFSAFPLSSPHEEREINREYLTDLGDAVSGQETAIDENFVPTRAACITTLHESHIGRRDWSWSDGSTSHDDAANETASDDSSVEEMVSNEVSAGDAALTTTVAKIQQRIMPHLAPYLSSASSEERQLLHFWITSLSGMMIPTQRRDNPFQIIFIPLALTTSDTGCVASGNAALLHAIYALSAFNRAQISPMKEHLLSAGTKHHQKSLRYLRQSLIETKHNEREALLATIIAMSSIEVIRGTSSSWRIHLTGGRSWLETLRDKGWADKYHANTLHQIFLCIEAMSPGHRRASSGTTVQDDALLDHIGPIQTITSPESIRTGYILDKVFGITEQIFYALLRINQLSRRRSPIESEKLEQLEEYIRINHPDCLVTVEHDDYDELSQHHACAFYYACLIHFHRILRGTAPGRLQRLVQRCLYHLGEINRLETDQNVCGLLWPLFITACEVGASHELREACIRLFDKGYQYGIGNMCAAATVVLEVWRRRDETMAVPDVDVTWQDVMDDLGIDILLT